MLEELKRTTEYIDKTDWLFQRNTANFTSYIPFENLQNDELLSLPPSSHTPF
jgi:hypothetical protein